MSDVIVDTAPNGAIQLLKEECWKLNFLYLKDETCQATELTELYGHSETSSKETLIEEKSPKTKCPASVAGAADIHNTNEEASEESPNNDVVDVQDELLALVSVEKGAAGDGKVLSKVVKPKGCLKESCKDQLTPTIYDMITELPKSYFGSTESLPEMCSRGPKVCSGVPEVSNAVGEVSSDTKTTEAADDLLDTGNVLSKAVQLSTQSHPEVCNGEAELCSGPEVCSGVPGVSSGGPGGCSGVPMVCSGVPEVSNAVEEVSNDTKTTEAAEDLLDTGKVLSKVVNPKGWMKQDWEDQLTRDFNDMIAKVPKSYFGSTESLPEVCSRGPEASNAVEEVCSDTMKIEATGNLLKTGNGLSKVVLLSTESRPEVCIRVPEVFCGDPEVCSEMPEVYSGDSEVCRECPEMFSEVPEAPNAVEEVSSDTKTEAAEDLRDTENVLSKVVRSKGWLKEGWEDQLTKDFNDMIARLPKSYFASNESLPEVCSGVPEVSNAAEVVRSDTKKQKKNGVLRFFRRVWKFFTCTNSLPKEQ
ncbi:uncharacterized protein LOC120022668 [Salvelinus namaycush]|uniref:Uncharacterized protein LOC120022668 n=1 Tax=Salvelinus namaycush TaxID=8040 RepID=A0A8U0PCZ0_SALNM|nr:uncharacterized protein LOC120022668 [Salvelinus namaycush]